MRPMTACGARGGGQRAQASVHSRGGGGGGGGGGGVEGRGVGVVWVLVLFLGLGCFLFMKRHRHFGGLFLCVFVNVFFYLFFLSLSVSYPVLPALRSFFHLSSSFSYPSLLSFLSPPHLLVPPFPSGLTEVRRLKTMGPGWRGAGHEYIIMTGRPISRGRMPSRIPSVPIGAVRRRFFLSKPSNPPWRTRLVPRSRMIGPPAFDDGFFNRRVLSPSGNTGDHHRAAAPDVLRRENWPLPFLGTPLASKGLLMMPPADSSVISPAVKKENKLLERSPANDDCSERRDVE